MAEEGGPDDLAADQRYGALFKATWNDSFVSGGDSAVQEVTKYSVP